jgi:DHA2 family multidrug resistance protein
MGQAQDLINRIVDQQAFMVAADDIFYASGLLFLVLIAVIWLARPVRGSVAGKDAASGAH